LGFFFWVPTMLSGEGLPFGGEILRWGCGGGDVDWWYELSCYAHASSAAD
jgi:hypothetical protein